MVIARTVKRLTATRPYRNNGNNLHRSGPCLQELYQNVDVANGKLKQQNMRSEIERFMMNIAVAFFSLNIMSKYMSIII